MLLVVTGGIAVFGLLFVPLFASGTIGVMSLLVLGFTLMGLTFGPMAALLPELFPANVRYTGASVAYNLASILGAAVAPFIAAPEAETSSSRIDASVIPRPAPP